MHYRRLSSFLMGVWLAGSILLTLASMENYRASDRLLQAPPAPLAETLAVLGDQPARVLLRHAAAEQNRWYFQYWEWTQLGLGLVLMLTLFLSGMERPSMYLLTFLMLLLVALAHWLLAPEMVRLGRAADFVAPGVPSPERTRFANIQVAYSTVEGVKFGLGVIVSLRLLLRGRRRSEDLGQDVDAVDDADDGHVDR